MKVGDYVRTKYGIAKCINATPIKENSFLYEFDREVYEKDGYAFVRLCKNGKVSNKRIHKLVANAFLGESNLQIDHIDGNKLNNNLNNLEYVTPKENTNRAWRKGLAHNTKHQREVAKQTMLNRWENNNYRIWRGKKTKSLEYRIGE